MQTQALAFLGPMPGVGSDGECVGVFELLASTEETEALTSSGVYDVLIATKSFLINPEPSLAVRLA
jgi:hypothetical protein